MTQTTCTLHEYFRKFTKILDELFSECEIFQTNIAEKNDKTHCKLNNFFSLKSRAVYVTMWKNIVQLDRQ